MVIDDSRYTQEDVNSFDLPHEFIRDIPETMYAAMETPKNIPKEVVNPIRINKQKKKNYLKLLSQVKWTLRIIQSTQKSPYLKCNRKYEWLHGNKEIIKTKWDNLLLLLLYLLIRAKKKVEEALGDESWSIALQEELNQFVRNNVWYLVPRPKDKHVIGTKWFPMINKLKMGSLWGIELG